MTDATLKFGDKVTYHGWVKQYAGVEGIVLDRHSDDAVDFGSADQSDPANRFKFMVSPQELRKA